MRTADGFDGGLVIIDNPNSHRSLFRAYFVLCMTKMVFVVPVKRTVGGRIHHL
jgi:hypothetical protein